MGQGTWGMDPGDEAAFYERELERASRRVDNTSKKVMVAKYNEAVSATVGSDIQCPCCGKLHKKTSYNKVFCSNYKTAGNRNCKDRYWNIVDETRSIKADIYARRY